MTCAMNFFHILFLVLFLWSSPAAYSQIELILRFRNQYYPLTPLEYYEYHNIELMRNGKFYKAQVHNKNIISLPDTGVYFLVVGGAIPMPVAYKVSSNEPFQVDTLLHSYIQPCSLGGGEYLFCCCDEYCDGHQIDYYPNGMKKVEAVFDRGEAIGNIYTYDLDGKVRFVYQFDKLRLLKKAFFYDEDHKKKRLRGDIQFNTLKYLFLKNTAHNMYKSEL
jgi:hypothetical protein